MNVKEIEQLVKGIPDEVFEIPQGDKLFRNIAATQEVSSFFEDGAHYVVLSVSTGPIPIATFKIFDDMTFTWEYYHTLIHNRIRLTKQAKLHIPEVLDKLLSYLSILGFKELWCRKYDC